MAWSLNFRGGAIQIPKITFTGDFSVTISATQVVGGRFFCGSDNTAGSLELYRNNSSKLQLFIGNVAQFAGATNLSANVNTPDLIVASRAGSTLSIFVNGTLQGTATFSGNMSVAWFGLRAGWSNYPDPMRLYYADLQDIANPSNSRYYDPSLSGGTGDTLPTTSGTNAGTQFNNWPLDDSEWVYYSSGADNESTIAYDIGAIDYTISSTIAAPNTTATIGYDVGAITFAASSTVSAPATTATIDYDIGAVSFATSATIGVKSATAFDIGSVDYSISASATSNASAAIAFDIGEINFDLSALVVSNISTVISYDIGAVDFAVYSTIPTNEPERSLMTKDNVFWRNSIFFKSGRI